MNNVITRLRERSRIAVGSTVAVLVSLPLGAAVGLSVPAGAEPGADDTQKSSTERSASRKAGASEPLRESTPWPQHDDPGGEHTDEFDALLFSRTAEFRHSNIDEGIAAIQALGAANHFTVTATEDPTAFTAENLEQYEVVIFLSTTGNVLNEAQQSAFEGYIQSGGGYAGIHAASDTEYDWPWYGNLVGSYFNNHPPGTPTATVKVEDHAHASTAGLPARGQARGPQG